MFPPLRIALLSPTEVQNVLMTIRSLAMLWKVRQPRYFYTLGLPAYQYSQDLRQYFTTNAHLNPILMRNFSLMYHRILVTLADIFQETVQFFPQVAVPGFHIYEFEERQVYEGGGAHFDLSYLQVLNQQFLSNPEDNYSFTVALSLPEHGAGIDIWDRTFFDNMEAPMSNEEVIKSVDKYHFDYQLGELFIFSGNMMHQISPLSQLSETDKRITVQGHVVRYQQQLIAYW